MKHPTILLHEIAPGDWLFESPRITPEIDDRLEEGIEWMQAGEFRKASLIFNRLIKELPEHIDAYHHLAMTHQRAGRLKKAESVWREVVALAFTFFPPRFDINHHQLRWSQLGNRPFLRAYHGMAFSLVESGKIDSACLIFERLLSLNPDDNLGARSMVVACCFELKRPAGVLKVCRQYPRDTLEHLVYGKPLALFQLGRLKQATDALNWAIELRPRIARELLKRKHRTPGSDAFVVGGSWDQAFWYWQDQGKHWQAPALEWLAETVEG